MIKPEGSTVSTSTTASGTALGSTAVEEIRTGTPQEVASAIAHLVPPAAALVHGAVLPVDGGRVAV